MNLLEPPYIINISSDVLINISVINNVILNCSFTGDLTHMMVYWMKGNRNLTDRTNVINNTAIINLSIDAYTEDYMGSYQCVVTNEAGFDSRTTRVLPKGSIILYTHMYAYFVIVYIGWTSPPNNVEVTIEYYSIENCSIIVSWNPPVYSGGLPIQCYKVEVSYGEGNK